jgi:hypothetical protein
MWDAPIKRGAGACAILRPLPNRAPTNQPERCSLALSREHFHFILAEKMKARSQKPEARSQKERHSIFFFLLAPGFWLLTPGVEVHQ